MGKMTTQIFQVEASSMLSFGSVWLFSAIRENTLSLLFAGARVSSSFGVGHFRPILNARQNPKDIGNE
jgi:hypothetical protein